jgi:hypothetical protein
MKYTFQKIFIIAIGSIFVLIGAVMAYPVDDSDSSVMLTILGVIFVIAGLVNMVTSVRRINKFQKKTYQWYKATHPLNIDGNRVTCFSCGGGRIHVRSLMNHTYHRDHFCGDCGTTLYFSPEGK